jgi:lipopolysaccharide export system protein LptC
MATETTVRNRLGSARATPSRRPRSAPIRPVRDIARASRFVALMKLVLPALAVALVGLVFAWPNLLPDQSQFRLGSINVDKTIVDGLRMDNPRYVGVDEEARPYEVAAAVAIQEGEDSNVIMLQLPRADLLVTTDAWVALQAADGIYDKAKQTLALSGGVIVFHDDGYQFQAPTATIDLAAGTAASDDPVRGQGMAGSIEGEGFRLLDRGVRIIFTGRSRLVIFPEHLKQAEK